MLNFLEKSILILLLKTQNNLKITHGTINLMLIIFSVSIFMSYLTINLQATYSTKSLDKK